MQPTVCFKHARDLAENDHGKLFPTADTCALALKLPVPIDHETLKEHLVNVVTMCDLFLLE